MKLGMNDGYVRGDKQTSNLVLIICPNYTKHEGVCFTLHETAGNTECAHDGGLIEYRRASPDISEVGSKHDIEFI